MKNGSGVAAWEYAVCAWAKHIGEAVDPDALEQQLTAGTIHGVLSASADRHPDKIALSVDDRSLTFAEFDLTSSRAAGWLGINGVEAGDRVLLCGPSSLELVTAYLGVLRAGATAVFANPGYTEPELQRIVVDSGAVAALTSPQVIPTVRRLKERSALRLIATLGQDLSGRSMPLPEVDSAGVALLAYTSGTTGAPRAVPLTHANVLASIRGAMLAWRWQSDDVLVHGLPLFHQHGLSGVHAGLVAGSRTVVLSAFDPVSLAETVAVERGSVLFAVPALYERLVASRLSDAMFRTLRLATSGSAPLSPSLAEQAADLIGQPPIERYGSTESGLNVSNPYVGQRRPGMVGMPLPGVELAIADDRGGHLCQAPRVRSSCEGHRYSTATRATRPGRRPRFLAMVGSVPATSAALTRQTVTWPSPAASRSSSSRAG